MGQSGGPGCRRVIKAMKRDETQDANQESLPVLFTRLADDLTQLFDTKIALLKVEVKEDVAAYLSGTTMILAGAVLAVVGFALLNVAVAFLIASLFQNSGLSQPVSYALGFIITAVIYLALGAALIIINKNKIAAQGLGPERTIAQLKKDKEMLQEEL